MNRIAIFAHYDRDATVDEYVLYYLRGLREVASRILFVSDSKLPAAEIAKFDGLAELVSANRHGEYDFGSWKRGIAYLGDALADYDELIICNDSCYAPIFPFGDAFARMATVDCDGWSATAAEIGEKLDYLHSYFLVFRRAILMDSDFRAFWSQIVPQQNAADVIAHYEVGLSHRLLRRGYRLQSLVRDDPQLGGMILSRDFVRCLVTANRIAWLKVKLFRDNPLRVSQLGTALTAIDHSYPRQLIDQHLRRIIGTDNPDHYHFRLGTFRRRWRPLQIIGRIRHDRWWKVQVRLYGVRVFAFGLPLRPRR